jgi:amino acid permease
MFVFEGNGVILNLRASAENKKRYPRILTLAILLIVILYIIIAVISYCAFRIDIPTYVTNAIPIDAF